MLLSNTGHCRDDWGPVDASLLPLAEERRDVDIDDPADLRIAGTPQSGLANSNTQQLASQGDDQAGCLRKWDEAAGRNLSEARMRPSRQGLDGK